MSEITGYRALTADEIDLINRGKELSKVIGSYLELVERAQADPRWLAIGKTQLQQGMMAVTRSIAKPTTF